MYNQKRCVTMNNFIFENKTGGRILAKEVWRNLNAKGKRVVEFSGIIPNPTYSKVQEGARYSSWHHRHGIGTGSEMNNSAVITHEENEIYEILCECK